MGHPAGQDRVVSGGRTEVRFEFASTASSVLVRVSADDELSVFHASGEVGMQRYHDRGWFREALWNACVIVRERARALRRRGQDQDLVSEWNEYACASEMFRLLRIGILEDRRRRGNMRAVDLRSVAGGLGTDALRGADRNGDPSRAGAE